MFWLALAHISVPACCSYPTVMKFGAIPTVPCLTLAALVAHANFVQYQIYDDVNCPRVTIEKARCCLARSDPALNNRGITLFTMYCDNLSSTALKKFQSISVEGHY